MDREQLRLLQETELGILRDVAELCEKHGIKYYLDCGTLLGAIRHNGFIPWDDDVDISMPSEDYFRFIEIAQDELGDKYFVQNFLTDDNFFRSYTKIRLNNTMVMPVYWKQWKIHHGAWIDIFPMFFADSEEEVKKKRKVFVLSGRLQAQNYYRNAMIIENYSIRSIRNYLYVSIYAILPMSLRKKIHKKMLDYICSRKEGRYLVRCVFKGKQFDRDSYLREDHYHQFEHLLLRIPSDSDRVLRETYGDYMQLPPENKRGNHGEMEISI